MSNDLISRNAVIKAMHNFVEQHRNDDEIQWTGCDWMLKEDSVIDIINRQPTAYDVDKATELQGRAAAYRDAVKTVKSGGIE